MRRLHKKSRTGCDTCRRRRVKCDEASPTCSNCSRREEECSYPRPLRADIWQPPTGAPPSPSSTLPVSHLVHHENSDPQANQLVLARGPARLKELELMHQWCMQTYRITRTERAEVLRGGIVHIALRHGYLMNSILALSSLHIASETKQAEVAREYVIEALHYQNQSIPELGQVLWGISRDNCDAIILTSVFNMISALLMPLIPAKSKSRVESTADMMLRIREHSMGIVSIFSNYIDWIREGSLAPLLQDTRTRGMAAMSAFSRDILLLLNNTLLANVSMDSRNFPLMQNALNKLEQVLVESNDSPVFRWLMVTEPDFLRELERGESIALVIAMCWGALVYSLDQVWWTMYTGRRVVEELSEVLNERGEEWNEVTQWCCNQVRHPEK